MKYINIKKVDKMVKKQNNRGNGRTIRMYTAWYSALLVLSTALLMLTGCPETPADQSDTTAPEPIAISNANITVSPSSISLQWESSPSDDVAEIQITWTPKDGEEQPKVIAVDSTNTTITGLNPDTEYAFSITAIDTAGNESSVAEISATTPSAVLFTQEEYSFTDLDVAPGTTVGSVSATVAPADPSITFEYEIIQNDDDDSALFVIDSTTAEITIGTTALDPTRTDYSFTVQATSSQGVIVTTAVVVSPTSSVVSFTQDSYSFSGIENTPGSTVGSVSATVVSPPADPPITLSYQIVDNNDDDSALFVIDSATAEITIGATVLDTTRDDYSFTVQVTSSQGVIVTTAVVVSPSLDTTAPDPLTEVSATTTEGTTAVTLSWKNSGSTDATTIRIVWTETVSETGGGTHDITDSTITSFDIPGLTSEVGYTFTLTVLDDAINAAGDPDPNESSTVTRMVTPDNTAPTAVTDLTATPLESGTEVELRWTNSGSADAATLDIAWSSSAGGVSGSTSIPSEMGTSTHTIGGLTPVTLYTFTITVADDANNISDIETADPITTLANPVDADGDTLIDIGSLEQLHNMRYNLNGTSYKTSSNGTGALCGDDAAITCTGYELTDNLTFDSDGDVRTYDLTSYALDAGDHHATYFPVTSGTGGWLPIGGSNRFNTIFEGNGFFIRGLAVRRNQTYIGMFGRTHRNAIIRNIRLTNNLADYTGSSDSSTYVGGLVALNEGTIIASHAGGPADGGHGTLDYVGGLVGQNNGTITASYATGDADGGAGTSDRVGGLVGRSVNGTIIASYATGDADAGTGNYDYAGGLAGYNSGTIIASYATGNADGDSGTDDIVGGLVGFSTSSFGSSVTIIASYATGDADGGINNDDRVGGLVGENDGPITASYATGNANGGGAGTSDKAGSLAGENSGTITASYGFGSDTNGSTGPESSGDLDPDAVGAGNNPGIAGARRLQATGGAAGRSVTAAWNQASSNTQNAWDFGTDSQAPALRYADYDGAGGNTYGCGSSSTATIVIPDRVPAPSVPGGLIDVICDTTLLGGPQSR